MTLELKRKKALQDLKIKLKQLEIDYFVLPNSDSFFLEFLPERYKRIKFLTGFDGSNACLLIGHKKSYFFTDGRYILQAKKELDLDEFEIIDMTKTSVLKKISEEISKNNKVAIDPKLHSVKFVEKLQEICDKKKSELFLFQRNPVDHIWNDASLRGTELERPKINDYKVVNHSIKYSGEKSKDKIERLLKKCKSDAMLICEAESIAWLFNIRCHGAVQYSPILPCYVILYKDGSYDFFADYDESNDGLVFFKDRKQSLFGRVKFSTKPSKEFSSIDLDPKQVNYAIYKGIVDHGVKVNMIDNLILAMKAVKNEVEIKNAIKAHEIDGLAVTKFLYWIDRKVKLGHELDELRVEERLLRFRSKNKYFVYDSFRSISGFGENGAIIHYHASKESNRKFKKNSLYLIDSGGQYPHGTTDVTRTVAVGRPTKEMKEDFTLVLKGHIALDKAVFDKNTSGAELDSLARQFLAKKGKDYAHGTGHGVGSYLSVHEGPVSISKRSDEHYFKPGMILSNEPGYYKEGEYGIRIENLVLVEKRPKNTLGFTSLTLAPIDYRLVEFDLLDEDEKKWLKEYHEKILMKFKSKLTKDELAWMLDIVDSYNY